MFREPNLGSLQENKCSSMLSHLSSPLFFNNVRPSNRSKNIYQFTWRHLFFMISHVNFPRLILLTAGLSTGNKDQQETENNPIPKHLTLKALPRIAFMISGESKFSLEHSRCIL